MREEKLFDKLSKEIKEKYINLFLEKVEENIFDANLFNQESITKEKLNKIIEIIINKNTVKSFKGDLSTNSLIKFYHFTINSNIKENEKNDFISNF